MKKLLLTLLLSVISSQVFAVVGETYYCETQESIGLGTADGLTVFDSESFAFTRNKKEIVFSSHNYFYDIRIPTDKNKKSSTSFEGGNSYFSFRLLDLGGMGQNYSLFRYTEIRDAAQGPQIIALIAKCNSVY